MSKGSTHKTNMHCTRLLDEDICFQISVNRSMRHIVPCNQ